MSAPMTMSASRSPCIVCRATSIALCVAVSAAYAPALGKLLCGRSSSNVDAFTCQSPEGPLTGESHTRQNSAVNRCT